MGRKGHVGLDYTSVNLTRASEHALPSSACIWRRFPGQPVTWFLDCTTPPGAPIQLPDSTYHELDLFCLCLYLLSALLPPASELCENRPTAALVLLLKRGLYCALICNCKPKCQRIDAFELWSWRKLLRVLWTARRSDRPILKEINPEFSLERLGAEAEAPILWPPNAKSQRIGKDPDSGKD